MSQSEMDPVILDVYRYFLIGPGALCFAHLAGSDDDIVLTPTGEQAIVFIEYYKNNWFTRLKRRINNGL